jgi:hypothetical protein
VSCGAGCAQAVGVLDPSDVARTEAVLVDPGLQRDHQQAQCP